MKITRALIFLIVAGIVGLHSLIPHDHHQSETFAFSPHNSSESIFDQIALGFHLSQVDGELEDVVFCLPVSIEHFSLVDFDLCKLPLEVTILSSQLKQKLTSPFLELASESHLSVLSLRGPPQA